MNARHRFLSMAGPALLALAAGSGRADDTDIYIGNTAPPGSEPMVMFSLDYRPNLGSTACNGDECDFLIEEGYLPAQASYTFFDVLRAVLKKVMDPLEGVKIGLMLNHDNQNNCQNKVAANCSNGGYIALGFRTFQADDANGAKAAFHNFLASMPVPQGNQSHSYQGNELFFEFYRYLSGQGIYNGHVGFTDYASNGNTNLDVDHPSVSWDAAVENPAGTHYVTPILASASCAKIFTVNIMFQVSNQESDSNNAIKAAVPSGGMGLSGNIQFPQVIRWLRDADIADGTKGTAPDLEGIQNVTSYFIVDPTKINTTTRGYAQAGGTGVPLALSEDPEELVRTLTDIFRQILSVSTTFVAASVPVNVFNRAEMVDNVYLALFQVDKDARPRWPGNLKKVKIAWSADAADFVDANGQTALAADGRLRHQALTFWTVPGSLPPPDTANDEVAGADGRAVARGAAGQKIPGFISGGPGTTNGGSARRLYYDNGSALSALNADASTATALRSDLGAATDAEALELLKFARGLDVDDEDGDGNVTEARSWLMGDPLHSQPLPLNYGARGGYSTDNQAIYIAMGSNDGFLRMFRNTTSAAAEDGQEVWALMPRSVMDKLATLRTNGAGLTHPYMVDGSPVAWMEDTNKNGTIDSGEKAYLFFGLGRGGQNYYGLDISDPENPSLLWAIDDTGDTEELAQTLSDPQLITVNTGSGKRPALIFGGGYDLNKDARTGNPGTDDSHGNAVFVIDALTGDLIWKAVGGGGTSNATTFYHAKFLDSVSSAVAAFDSDGNGYTDRFYVGDTGGNVWRGDINGSDTTAWKLTLLASLGRHAAAGLTKVDDRRFHHRPDVVQSMDEDGNFDAVLIGSGDRPDPLDKGGMVNNWFFMIKDRFIAPGAGVDSEFTPDDLGDVTDTCLTEGGTCDADLANGWRLELLHPGEKALARPVTAGGTVYFTTYVPQGGSANQSCAPAEGDGYLYAVGLQNAAARKDFDTTVEGLEREQLLDQPGIPAHFVIYGNNPECTGSDCTYGGGGGQRPKPLGAETRFPTYWFEGEDVEP